MAKNKAKANRPAPKPRVPQAVQRVPKSNGPRFCFRFTDRKTDSPWAFSPSPEHSERMLGFIQEMARRSWGEILSDTTGGKGHRVHHYQDVSDIDPDAQAYIKKQGLDDDFGDTLFRFRLGKTERLWGFRADEVFHVLWWDPEHLVYPLN